MFQFLNRAVGDKPGVLAVEQSSLSTSGGIPKYYILILLALDCREGSQSVQPSRFI